MKDYLSTTEAARILGVGTSSIKRWCEAGEIDCIKTPGRHRRFKREVIEAFRKSRDQKISQNKAELIRFPSEHFSNERAVIAWTDMLLEKHSLANLELELLAEHSNLGSWWRVAKSIEAVLGECDRRLKNSELSNLDIKLFEQRLIRVLGNLGRYMSLRPSAHNALLMMAEGSDESSLRLYFSELILNEAGVGTFFAGQGLSAIEAGEACMSGKYSALLVDSNMSDRADNDLLEQAKYLEAACSQGQVTLLLSGGDAWPEKGRSSVRITSYQDLVDYADSIASVR